MPNCIQGFVLKEKESRLPGSIYYNHSHSIASFATSESGYAL